MTRAWRAGILLAFFAALLGAPSAVLGARPNCLSAPTVSATSGSTSTIFTFGVRYTSSGNRAETVTVRVAGMTLTMGRVSGSETDGTYGVSSALPTGAWIPTFEAHPSKGRKPSIAGPQVHVHALATPKPSMLPSPPPVSVRPSSSAEIMPAADPAGPVAVTEPQPTAAAVAAAPVDTAPDSASGDAAPTHEHVDAPTPAQVASGRGSSAPAAPVDPAPGSTASDSLDTAASPSFGGRRAQEPGQAAAPFTGFDSPWSVLTLAVFGVATLGILAIAWMLLGRRRRDHDREPLVATGAVRYGALPSGGTRRATERGGTRRATERGGAPAAQPGGAPATDELLGRAARRSRLDPSDDPIVAAMGLSPRAGATPRYGAGQVNQGPGERPLGETKRRRRP